MLGQFPAVAILGPRQVGKTTLARHLVSDQQVVHLDLERPSDLAKLDDPEQFFASHDQSLVVLDEVQRAPDLFKVLRGVIDERRRQGRRSGQFLLLGSASLDLLRQSGESLAGRIAYVELAPLTALEVPPVEASRLWVRGGFPESFLAENDAQSMTWREAFIRTYLERDIPQLGSRIPAETLRRFWTMLAHAQGGLLRAADLARSLAVDGKTVARYLDMLVDLLLVRRLQPYHVNIGKRLVKAPKVFVRDSGIVHSLLGLGSYESLLGHPVQGGSWEGFVIESLLAAAPVSVRPWFYRTATGNEIDLVLEMPGGELWAVEIKSGLAPRLERGFYSARGDLSPARSFVVYAGSDRFPLENGVEAIGLHQLAQLLRTEI